ncbi:Acetyl-coenzyme A synthetase [Micrococcus lylae]|uniref:Acetyl-coenzyme A synthetase n=2 Tax=Micrococcus lylae TaxID=1273 RepID=A0A1R4IHV2_9MICC|nr:MULTISPECIES: AMP-binding protein [Micrococcus]OFR86735.1 AMP-dependent synthetase [Micrococcus sp. HMSC067E09]SJN19396.1 Acetyl-coenzyme A synthetase [Micrococcus lylae]
MTVTEELRAARDLLVKHQQDYDAARREFVWPRFTEFNFATDWFDQLAADPQRGTADALVIVEEDGRVLRRTYADLSASSKKVAAWLQQTGVQRGHRLILMLDNQVELWETMLACIRIGAVMVPTTTQMTAVDLQDRVDRAEARWAVANAKNLAKFTDVEGDCTLIHVPGVYASDAEKEVPQVGDRKVLFYEDAYTVDAEPVLDTPTAADETLLLYFTSGTTSKPKLVEHTHTSYPVGHLSTIYWIGLQPGDVHLNVASPGWAKHAWSNVFAPWLAEATIFVLNFGKFEAGALMKAMQDGGVTSFCAPPTVWRMLIKADLTQLKTPPKKAISAGEPLNAEVIDQVQRAWDVTIRDGFGQTETTLQIANTPGARMKIGGMGRPLPGYEIVLIDPLTGQEADEGEICVKLDPRPVGVLKSYFGNKEKTDEVFRDGLYHTGDIASKDEQGVYTYVGRADDVFKSSDYKVSPFELESVLVEHPAVMEGAIVPTPDEMRLAVPKAFVTLAAGYEPNEETAREILQYTVTKLPPYKRIRRIEFRELPKTISGKVRRVELRSEEVKRHGGEEVGGVEYREEDLGIQRPKR